MSECTDTGCYNYSTGECQAPSPLAGLIGGTRGCTAHSSVAGWATCTDTPPHSSLAIYEQEEVIRCSSIPNILYSHDLPADSISRDVVLQQAAVCGVLQELLLGLSLRRG